MTKLRTDNKLPHTPCCLIQRFRPSGFCSVFTKSEPRCRISKEILEETNRKPFVNITKVNQWKSTLSMLQWFKQLANKGDSAFKCFEVVEFYPSITEALLKRALDFASEHVNISADERQAVINSKHSLLFKANRGKRGVQHQILT